MARPSHRTAAALGGVLFLTTLCTLLLEILLTRVLSVMMWYHFTFAVISVSLLGIAAGAMACHRRFGVGSKFDDDVLWRTLTAKLTLFSIAVAFPIVLMTRVIATPTFSVAGVVLLLGYFAACAAPFYASGYLTATIFRFGPGRVSSLYAVDLLGASLGGICSIPLLNYLGGIGSLLAVAVTLAAAAVVVGWRHRSPSWVAGLSAFFALAVSLGVQLQDSRIDVRTVKLSGREEVRPILDVKWNTHSRLVVLDYFNPTAPRSFFLSWGLSDRYTGWLPRQYLITIDGASETPITALGEDIAEHQYLAWDITSLPYHVRPRAKTLVIGAGGGRDILTALSFGSRDITAVELNQGIVDWMTGPYAEFAGRLYTRPEVRFVVDDGRNFVRSSRDAYDVLQISMVDTFAATTAGAYTLAENNLYTAQAFDEYLDHLSENGILAMNRYFLEPPQQTLRVVTLAREALERRGISDPARHLVVMKKTSPLGDNGLVMVKKSPFTNAEIDSLVLLQKRADYDAVAVPGLELDNPFTRYLHTANAEAFYDSYPFDVRPPTDDRPFFFNTLKASTIASFMRWRKDVDAFRVYNLDAVFILAVLLVMATAALIGFVFLPLLLSARLAGGRSNARRFGPRLAYFVWVGLGFILVEVVLIQRFHLYLGHPVYSLAVVLVGILAFSSIGSALTHRLPDARLASRVRLASGLVLVAILGFEAVWTTFLDQTFGIPLWWRIGLTLALLLPVGVCMGMPYPLGLRAISTRQTEALPWVWAVNAAASVLGSVLAFALAMAAGFQIVLVIGGLCYVGAMLSAPALLSTRSRERVYLSSAACQRPRGSFPQKTAAGNDPRGQNRVRK